MKKTIGIVGFGNMGSAIAERIKDKYQVFVFDKDKNKTENLADIKVAASIRDMVNKVDTLILAVKPQDFDEVLNEIKNVTKDKLIISIAAGITTSYIEKVLKGARVVRAMPNLPAKIGAGMTCLCKGKTAKDSDLDFTERLFNDLGKALILEDENMMDAATAVSGSGPGFLCDLVEGKSLDEIRYFAENVFVPTLTATAGHLGFTAVQAAILASMTSEGTVKYIEVMHLSPEEVKKQVTSKKGTTEVGLAELKHNVTNLETAVEAAVERAKELSKS